MDQNLTVNFMILTANQNWGYSDDQKFNTLLFNMAVIHQRISWLHLHTWDKTYIDSTKKCMSFINEIE